MDVNIASISENASGVPDRALLDTGVVVALLHRDDADHERVRPAFEAFRGTLLTTEAIVTEALFLLASIHGGQAACLEFFIRGGAVLVPASRASLIRSKSILARYSNLPADYADATLVALGDEMETYTIFTLDRRDFSVYRGESGQRFQLIP